MLHLVTQKIKDMWRKKKLASVLFLDIQATFPNTVRERLIYNMRSRQVPSVYIKLIDNMLSKHKTQLKFDNYTSEPIEINNGTTQGCPLSMLMYTYYNADLIDTARGKNELFTGFMDDSAFVAVGDMVNETHLTLKSMMERSGGARLVSGPQLSIQNLQVSMYRLHSTQHCFHQHTPPHHHHPPC